MRVLAALHCESTLNIDKSEQKCPLTGTKIISEKNRSKWGEIPMQISSRPGYFSEFFNFLLWKVSIGIGLYMTADIECNWYRASTDIAKGFLSAWINVRTFWKFLGECKTESGPEPRRPCVFPFIYNGVKYNECTFVDWHQPWCSVEVNDNQNHIDGKWGNCKKTCNKGKIF